MRMSKVGRVRIGGSTRSHNRPTPLIDLGTAIDAAMQKRPQRFKEQQFLDLLYQAYKLRTSDEWRKIEKGQGPVVPLAELHDLLTILPGSDYSIEEFGRDLLLLDRKPDLRTRDRSSCQFPGSTLGKTGVKRVMVYDEQGRERVYIGIRFIREP